MDKSCGKMANLSAAEGKMNEAMEAIDQLASYGAYAGQDQIIAETLAMANAAALSGTNPHSSLESSSKLGLVNLNKRGSIGSVLSVDSGNPLLPLQTKLYSGLR